MLRLPPFLCSRWFNFATDLSFVHIQYFGVLFSVLIYSMNLHLYFCYFKISRLPARCWPTLIPTWASRSLKKVMLKIVLLVFKTCGLVFPRFSPKDKRKSVTTCSECTRRILHCSCPRMVWEGYDITWLLVLLGQCYSRGFILCCPIIVSALITQCRFWASHSNWLNTVYSTNFLTSPRYVFIFVSVLVPLTPLWLFWQCWWDHVWPFCSAVWISSWSVYLVGAWRSHLQLVGNISGLVSWFQSRNRTIMLCSLRYESVSVFRSKGLGPSTLWDLHQSNMFR